jgi:hypothetical protein
MLEMVALGRTKIEPVSAKQGRERGVKREREKEGVKTKMW